MKHKHTVNQVEIATALKKFLDRGGVIMRLPDQAYYPQLTIGEDKYDIYEPIAVLSELSKSGGQAP